MRSEVYAVLFVCFMVWRCSIACWRWRPSALVGTALATVGTAGCFAPRRRATTRQHLCPLPHRRAASTCHVSAIYQHALRGHFVNATKLRNATPARLDLGLRSY